jgi:hypothetical protein
VPVALAVACSGTPEPRSAPRSPPSVEMPTERGDPPVKVDPRWVRLVCSLPRQQVVREWTGYHPERSGEVQFVLRPQNYFGNWSHSGPWDYLQRVPMLLYGPGHVPAVGEVDRAVTMADLAPTLARLVGFDFEAPDGTVMEEAVLPGAQPPKLVLTVVWDGGGRLVLDRYPRSWPTLRSLIPDGAWFDRATVGSSPSVTPAIHTTLGTGAFPRTHGVMDLRFEVEEDVLAGARGRGPKYQLVPSMTDLYDQSRGNEPLIGLVASAGTLGMIGRGTYLEGNDRDLAATQTQDSFGLNRMHVGLYEFPSYVRQIPGLAEEVRTMDLEDGQLDGRWMGEEIPSDLSEVPAFAPYETAVIEEVIRREGFGDDAVPDFLFVNYKQIDKVGHRWSVDSPQMEAVVRSSDDALRELMAVLDREVGEGGWVLALTADHGSTPDARETDSFAVDIAALSSDLAAAFDTDGDDRPAIQSARVTQIWIDEEELAAGGHTVDDVADFLTGYTEADNAVDPSATSHPNRPVFDAAFPGKTLEARLPCLPGRAG